MDLFEQQESLEGRPPQPLAARVRPTALEDIRGQEHILGAGCLLRRAIEADRLGSIILYGPPGCGKTSLAEVIARVTNRRFERSSGVISNVSELREVVKRATFASQQGGRPTILFVDEIHRFSKSQQDVLLPYVEDGTVTLVGATTHNPMFFVNGPLISRSLVFELHPLEVSAVVEILERAVVSSGGLAGQVEVTPEGLEHLAVMCEGDVRRALNALEIAALTTAADASGKVRVTREVAEDSIQKKAVLYDHDEEGHYDTISAFIKSVRGSDPHAATYWLAKMLYAGEDPRFIARRLIILASEDIGNADPRGLLVAEAGLRAVEHIGMPEARITLSQVTCYLATAPKSNASYVAIDKALDDIKEGRTLPVPEHLKNVHVASAEGGRENVGYVYPHGREGAYAAQEYVPTSARYYEPKGQGYEQTIVARMEAWEAQGQGGAEPERKGSAA